MEHPRPRDQETQELIERFRRKRAQRRRTQIIVTVLVFILIVGGAIATVTTLNKGGGVSFDDSGARPEASTAAASGSADGQADGSPISSTPSASAKSTATTRSTAVRPISTSVRPTASTAHTSQAAPSSTAGSTTSRPATATKSATASSSATGKTVVIDPGHQAKGDYSVEPMGPGSTTNKPKVSSGTGGVVTGTPESRLVLTVGLKLRDSLQAHGVDVIMTRTTQDVNISNIERARIANEAGADLFVRIHADGSDDAAIRGIHVLYPASIKGWTDDIAARSKVAASLAQQHLIAATGAKDRGINARGDMTGFNWSDVPVILPEIGFMTNPEEDRLLATDAYQDKIVQGLTRAILEFLEVK